MNILQILLALVCIPLLIAWVDIRLRNRNSSFAWAKGENMPRELRHAQLLMSEEPISMQAPIALHGIPDQVFDTGRMLIPVDTKTRRTTRVYYPDIVQLSIYRTILASTQDRPVAKYGYVRVVSHNPYGQRTVCYIKTKLLSPTAIVAMGQSDNLNSMQGS